MRNQVYLQWIITLLAGIIFINDTKACSCGLFGSAISVRDYNSIPYIFSGTVKDIIIDQQQKFDKQKRVLVTVDEVFKGAFNSDSVYVYTAISDASCGLPMQPNQQWVIWAYLDDNDITTHLCTRSTQKMYYSSNELNLLRYLQKSPSDSVWLNAAGQKIAEGKLFQQKPIGYWKYYYPNGYLDYEGDYLNEKQEGTWIKYLDPEGIVTRLKYDKKIPKDSMPDLRKLMHKIFTIENYKEGIRDGEFIYFQYASYHKPSNISNYRKGKLHGKMIRYYDNGQIFYEQNYLDGELHGDERFYYESGQLRRSGKFVNGKASGEFTLYDEDGKLIKTAMNKRVE